MLTKRATKEAITYSESTETPGSFVIELTHRKLPENQKNTTWARCGRVRATSK